MERLGKKNLVLGEIMETGVYKYQKKRFRKMAEIWNEVVEEGIAFPQEEKA